MPACGGARAGWGAGGGRAEALAGLMGAWAEPPSTSLAEQQPKLWQHRVESLWAAVIPALVQHRGTRSQQGSSRTRQGLPESMGAAQRKP